MSQEMLTEFAITELEDRLEFAEICNDNCKCQPAPTPTPTDSAGEQVS